MHARKPDSRDARRLAKVLCRRAALERPNTLAHRSSRPKVQRRRAWHSRRRVGLAAWGSWHTRAATVPHNRGRRCFYSGCISIRDSCRQLQTAAASALPATVRDISICRHGVVIDHADGVGGGSYGVGGDRKAGSGYRKDDRRKGGGAQGKEGRSQHRQRIWSNGQRRASD